MEICDVKPKLGLNRGQTKPKISGTVPTNRHTTIPNDSVPIPACFDDDPKFLNWTHLGFEYMVLRRLEIADLWGLGGAGGPKNHSKSSGMVFGGRRGRPDPEKLRSPAGPKTMY